ncbi:MAG: transcription-repair coupling factor [Candidatus Solibacter sp.]|nr:transcription-repair coupling factor [Candidatus Solibacter sp.]
MINPAVREKFGTLARHQAFQELVRRLSGGRGSLTRLGGLTPTAKALYLTLLWEALETPVLVVTESNGAAEKLVELLDAFHTLLLAGSGAPRPALIPAFDALPGQGLSPHTEIREQRAVGLHRMATGRCSIVVAPAAAALLRHETAAYYRQLAVTVRKDEEIGMDDLASHIESAGYRRADPVQMEGEYSIRGGIFDVFPAESHQPVRIEFFGDTVESLRRFDPQTQRSVLKIEEVALLPLEETPRTRAAVEAAAGAAGVRDLTPGETFPGWEFYDAAARERKGALEDLLDAAVVVWDEPEDLIAASERLWKRLDGGALGGIEPEKLWFRWGELAAHGRDRSEIELRRLALEGEQRTALAPLEIGSRQPLRFRNNMQAAVAEARNLVQAGHRVMFFAPAQGEVERLADIFAEYALPFQLGIELKGSTPAFLSERAYMASDLASVYVVQGQVRRGVVFPDSKLALIGYEDLFETAEAEAPSRRSHMALFTPESLDLKAGDYVVHARHGIGQYVGIQQIRGDQGMEDFLAVEYAGGSKLYVPLTRLDLIQKYRGSGEGAPTVDKLGGVTWARTKSRVKARMRDMAEELLKLYAARRAAQGFAFSPDSNWQREFEDSFEYPATRDQLQATLEIKRDMEGGHPMDRLLCGDVGFGKTEVAMRAAFKALGDGKQVAVLAPTTVLAFQHYETFRRRFQAFPVRIELLSRFRSPKEIKLTLEDLAAGKVDVVIGTHRLLSNDVAYPDLGLLVVDEEQRFGVRHKERLKQLRHNLDVLTMSATPIPRTLHMSLLGLRDMSVIETPPKDRLSIHTVVARFNTGMIRTAIEQEMSRGGQVYYIHNRVESIWSRAASIQQLAPNSRVSVGHGQMGEDALEKVLLGFMRHESDVFVATTIVENGLDIPRANTIIIENAQNYGLSELYQLRGRVGRSNRRAYAYLVIPEDGELTEVARKRLAALKEFSDLGAGFKIAALDLELRGAGNLLGGEQHGHIGSVGYETYLKLLDETARELRGETVGPEIHSSLNLGLDIRIPPGYIGDEQQRLRAYKRIADAGEPGKAAAVLEELADRYGEPPETVRRLVEFSRLKTRAERAGIESIEKRGQGINVKFHPGARVDPRALMELVSATAGAQFTPAGILRLPLEGATGTQDGRELLERINGMLDALGAEG